MLQYMQAGFDKGFQVLASVPDLGLLFKHRMWECVRSCLCMGR